jgi:putative endonuclease
MACYCYIIECADGSLYTGWTTDPERRIEAHNAGTASRYTRARRPVRLVLLETARDKPSAMRRELAIKSMPRTRKLRLIAEAAGYPGKRGGNVRRVRRGRRSRAQSAIMR